MNMLSIITPSYNRSYTLERAFISLKNQTYKDFEWIIVDDGSVDDTEVICKSFVSNDFPIRYYKKENGGKHTAVNMGVKVAKGDYILILDSDDSLPSQSVEIIHSYCLQVDQDCSFGGVAGYMAHHNGDVIGHGCERRVIDSNAIDIRYLHHLKGDMCEVFRASILREFTFPEVEGERFCPESLLWNRIALHYKLRYFPEVVYYRDYLDGGLTDNIIKIRMKSPLLTCMCYAEQSRLRIPFVQRMKSAINYWRFGLCVKGKKQLSTISCWWMWTWLVGYIMHKRDKRVTGL